MSPLAAPLLRTIGRYFLPAGTGARLSILMYHRVLREQDPLLPDEPHAAAFDTQMAALRGVFNVLPLTEAVSRLRSGTLPARSACVTFDDGYRDNVEVALPILQRHGILATFFVTTGFLDGGRMFNDTVIEAIRAARGESLDLDDLGLGYVPLASATQRRGAIDAVLSAVKYLAPADRANAVDRLAARVGCALPDDLMMDSPQVLTLLKAGMEIGAHTVHHPILTQIAPDTANREIVDGKSTLEAITQTPVRVFAYPNGVPAKDYGPEHVPMVRDAGFVAAVSTSWGTANRSTDPYQLPRFTPWDRTPARFAARLLYNGVRHTAHSV